jgi:hypothetical protein
MLDETCHQVLMTDRHLYPIQWNAIDHLSAADQVTVVALFRRAFLYGVVTPEPEPRVWIRVIRILDDEWREFDVMYATPYGDLERFTVIAWYNDELKLWECDCMRAEEQWEPPMSVVRNVDAFTTMVTEQFDIEVDRAISADEE